MVYIDVYILDDRMKFKILRGATVIRENEIAFPACYSTAQKLNYIRNLVEIFINEYKISSFKVKINDLNNDTTDSIKIEGVLEELFLSRGVQLWR